MAQPSETFDSYDAVGNREDLSDIIYNISPTQTPFLTMAARAKASATSHEWQTDTLAAAAANAQIEGDEASGDAVAATVRPASPTQISDKVVVISGTQEAVDKAGRKSEVAYQITKRAKELKRDMELDLTQHNARVVGDATTAREYAGLECWYQTTTNHSRGASGAACPSTGGIPDAGSSVTDTTATRALTESMLKDVIRNVWNEGGEPTFIMCGPKNKQNISAFTGGSTRTDKGEDKRVTAAVDVYVSDFDTHRVVPNRFSRDRTVHVLTPRLWAVAYLRTFRQYPLAKTGDSERRQLLTEYTIEARQQAGNGVIADLTTT